MKTIVKKIKRKCPFPEKTADIKLLEKNPSAAGFHVDISPHRKS